MHRESEAPCFAMVDQVFFECIFPDGVRRPSTACGSLLMLRSRVIVCSMTTSREGNTSCCSDSTLRPYMPCHGQEQLRPLSYLQFMKMAVREELSYFDEAFLG